MAVGTDIFSCFGMWNSCPELVQTFQLYPTYEWVQLSSVQYLFYLNEQLIPCVSTMT
jgi:hypothetical protein